jgi:hypothetical protein
MTTPDSNRTTQVVYRHPKNLVEEKIFDVPRDEVFDQPDTKEIDGEQWVRVTGSIFFEYQLRSEKLEENTSNEPTGDAPKIYRIFHITDGNSPPIEITDAKGRVWSRVFSAPAISYDMVNLTKLVKEKDGGAFHERMQAIKANMAKSVVRDGFGSNGRYTF